MSVYRSRSPAAHVATGDWETKSAYVTRLQKTNINQDQGYRMEHQFNELRYWTDQPPLIAPLDNQDAALDREDSLSERSAFQLGEDMGRLRFTLEDALDPEMRRGYLHGLKQPAKSADVYLRKLLNLRRNAYSRRIPVSSALNRDYLKSITVTVCPVSGENLTQGTLTDSDWSVDRLDNDMGYVPGNLCIMSTRINRLKDKAQYMELADDARKCLLRDGPEALCRPLGSGLTVLEVLRLASLTAGPYSVTRGFVARHIPFAMAPKSLSTVDAVVAGMHLECARTRLEGRGYAKRVNFFKHLGDAHWRMSNQLVNELRTALSRGDHPADMWLDGRCAMLLTVLTDALMEGPVLMPEVDAETAFEKVMSGIAPLKNFLR